jgi:hypothetical protein
MNPRRAFVAALVLTALSMPGAIATSAQGSEWKTVEDVFGFPGANLPGGVIRFNMPRSDLHVTVAGIEVKPALALGAWAAFRHVGPNDAMVMGDLVLTEDEVAPVMQALQRGGTKETAADLGFDVAAVEKTMGRTGTVSGGVLHFSPPRAEKLTEEGMDTPPSMGMGTSINFQPIGNGRAAIAGDFAMTAKEVEPVMKVLQDNGVQAVALHSHALDDVPRLFYMHFWATDDALKLATTLRSAVDQTNVAK